MELRERNTKIFLRKIYGRRSANDAGVVDQHIDPPESLDHAGDEDAQRLSVSAAEIEANRVRQREVIDAFLAAARGDDFTALLAVLDPDVVLRADAAAVKASAARASAGAPPLAAEVRGVAAVADGVERRVTNHGIAIL